MLDFRLRSDRELILRTAFGYFIARLIARRIFIVMRTTMSMTANSAHATRHVKAASEALISGAENGEQERRRTESRERWQAILQGFPAIFRTTPLVDLSRVGSTQYSEDFRIGQSLYTRGALFADELDATIRASAAGGRSLRDSIRAMMVWSAREKRGFKVNELARLIGEPVGVDVGSVFSKWLA